MAEAVGVATAALAVAGAPLPRVSSSGSRSVTEMRNPNRGTHGAHEGVWYGEDYAFSRNWIAAGETIWLLPDLDLTHHSATQAYPGNFHRFLLRQPGGSEAP